LFSALEALIARSQPTRAAIEQLFFGQNTSTAIAVGQARGVVLLALARAGVPVVELAPSVVKQAVAGYGRADKVQVQTMVTRLLGLPRQPEPDDAADALAVAWAALAGPPWEAAR
jgi:crossover junction endodeoxyribonuclease RuvC